VDDVPFTPRRSPSSSVASDPPGRTTSMSGTSRLPFAGLTVTVSDMPGKPSKE
jgi:hypothetical protein